MTRSVRIVNTSNWDEDVIVGRKGYPEQVLKRGEMSGLISIPPNGPESCHLRAGEQHGQEYLGEVVVEVDPPMPVGSFGWALTMLKKGHRVQRRGWNGKGMYLYLIEFSQYSGLNLAFKPCIVMHTAQGDEQPGWLASQPDMLGEDWEEYDG